jgi:glycosyltransferase involved in cell wall biosynthesis
MKVLMLGWEFPPHISGGLGTACEGITRGLAHTDVDVLFVVPRAFGDERPGRMSLRGANQVRLSRRVEEPGEEPSPGSGENVAQAAGSAAVRASGAGLGSEAGPAATPGASPARLELLREPRLELLAIDSTLAPYASAESYQQRFSSQVLALLERSKRLASASGRRREPLPDRALGWLALGEEIAAAVGRGERFEDSTFEIWGGYGAGLFDEVARYAIACAEIAKEHDFQLVHAHDWMTYLAGVAVSRLKGVPLVCHLHATEYDRTGDNPNQRVLAIERMGLAAADRVVCVSHYTASIARRRYGVRPERLRVVHNAVTQSEQRAQWHLERSIRDPIVLFLGRITFQKGPEYFIEAAARVVRERPRTRFVVSGSGDMFPEVVARSARLGLIHNLFFTGFLRGDDVERMYSMADLYVMPSVSEPFGITPLEAMALDVPVIVSRQSGVSEVLANALKVDFWDVEELANKILAVLEYAPLRRHLVEQGRDEVRRMRWELRGDLLRQIYRELVP